MLIKTTEIREQLEEIWPWFKRHPDELIFWDTKYYWAPPVAQLAQLIEKSTVHEMTFVPNFNDCDNYSLQFQAETRRKRYLAWKNGNLPEEQVHPLTTSMAWGNGWRGMSKNHKGNLYVCEEGIYMADQTPMEHRYWKANADNDNMLKINFA